MASARRRAVVALSRAIAPGVASGESDVRLSLQKQAGCRPYKATSAAAVGMQPIARPLLEIPMGNPKNNPHGLYVGQSLHFVPCDRRRDKASPVMVTSVGRKWAELSGVGFYGLRIDLGTLQADGRGYSSPGRCYLSEDIYLAEVELDSAWGALRRAVDREYSPPAGVTAEKIRQAAELLGVAGDE